MKKKLVAVLFIIMALCLSAFCFTACGEDPLANEDQDIVKVYNLYVAHVKEQGKEPLTYAEWLESVKGQDGVGIKSVSFDDQGRLIITLTDNTVLEIPERHTFGEWQVFGNDENECEEKTFYRVCSTCNEMQFKHGAYSDHDWETQTIESTCQAQGYDHKTCTICGKEEKVNYQPVSTHRWQSEYTTDNSFHWIKCNDCDATKDTQEHIQDESGYCTICNAIIGATEGIVYDMHSSGEYAIVVGYEGTAQKVIIAEEYNDKPVKSIYREAFRYRGVITSIVIPDSVTSIGDYAFKDCRSLTSVVIPDSVTSIGSSAFYNCSSLANVTIGDGVTSIGDSAFCWCDSLKSVTIGDSIESIGSSAFARCDSLKRVYYTGTIDGWAEIEFGNYESNPLGTLYYGADLYINNELVTEANITTATKISDYAFADCTSLTSVTIGDSVTSIGDYAFSGCHSSLYTTENSLKYVKANGNPYCILIGATNENLSTYNINPATKHITGGVFSSCERLSSIVIPDSVESIGSSAFENCTSLTSVEIGNSVTSIGDRAFYDCDSLTSVEIGDSVTSIGSYAFDYCNSLTDVYYKGSASEWNSISINNEYGGNADLINATRYYYIENEADVPTDGGNYWHYVDGVPTAW